VLPAMNMNRGVNLIQHLGAVRFFIWNYLLKQKLQKNNLIKPGIMPTNQKNQFFGFPSKFLVPYKWCAKHQTKKKRRKC
jgi:hypothetical protein